MRIIWRADLPRTPNEKEETLFNERILNEEFALNFVHKINDFIVRGFFLS